MNYCKKCRTLTEGDICPECSNENLVKPEDGDSVFLAECGFFTSELLSSLLTSRDIPFGAEGTGGSVVTQGVEVGMGNTRFFVSFADFEKASNALKSLNDAMS